MTHDVRLAQKVVRSLVAAEGYLELQLPERALAELISITNADEYEGLQPFLSYLTGEAHKQLGNFRLAIHWLHDAARSMPTPHAAPVWQSLSECFEQDGQPILADVAAGFARESWPENSATGQPLPAQLTLAVLIVGEAVTNSADGETPHARHRSAEETPDSGFDTAMHQEFLAEFEEETEASRFNRRFDFS